MLDAAKFFNWSSSKAEDATTTNSKPACLFCSKCAQKHEASPLSLRSYYLRWVKWVGSFILNGSLVSIRLSRLAFSTMCCWLEFEESNTSVGTSWWEGSACCATWSDLPDVAVVGGGALGLTNARDTLFFNVLT